MAGQAGAGRWWQVPFLGLVVGLALCSAVAVIQISPTLGASAGLIIVLIVAAVVAGATAVYLGAGTAIAVSGSVIVIVLTAALAGPGFAVVVAALSELATSLRIRTRPVAFASNLLAVMLPSLVAGNIVRLVSPGQPHDEVRFYVAVLAAGAVYNALNFVIAAAYSKVINGRLTLTLETLKDFAPSLTLNLGLAVAGAGIYVRVGLVGIVFAVLAVFALTYMLNLVQRARSRSEQYVSLSWGVLAGLMRALDIRDERAARHAAAVARFSQDIARAVGMTDADCELAHTAGLLHDIGRFALSDRVAERGRTLTEEDWTAIQRHPELGADMLRDLGTYGPVAEIVLAHHERIDGRGYPSGREGDDIPEIARIVAVAEVYDTLTANDTYRTQMSSFEALNELRRVSGSQLDGGYVEVLAELLAGVGVDYRHADTADFDSELDMERRIREAGAGA